MIHARQLRPEDRSRIAELLSALDAFTDDERAVALELVDARLARPEVDDYRFLLATDEPTGKLAGYLCYGPTPMTESTYDLYWIASSPDFARSGVGRGLLASMEADLAHAGGGLVRVETGSREGHGAAVHFYDATGFGRAAVIPDFYAPGDDLLIFTKRVAAERSASDDARDEASLLDAAFGYKDYAAERDFLLACARRFGTRPVERVLGWACGPARHLAAFADAGVSAVGVDGSDAMIAYARRVLPRRAGGPAVELYRSDLFERPGVAPVDLSFVANAAIHQLTTPDRIAAHLAHAAALLLPGGVHVVEATHPADLTKAGMHRTEWTEVRGAETVDARFRMHLDRLSPGRVVPTTLEVVCKTKGAPARSVVQERDWFVPDLDAWRRIVAAVPDLEIAAVLGDYRVDVPFEHAAAWRLLLVLRRV
jgi:ribosomal protein S18 acetylase RimI-like enzyme